MARIACLVAGGVYMVRVESGSTVVRVGETTMVRETWRVRTVGGEDVVEKTWCMQLTSCPFLAICTVRTLE